MQATVLDLFNALLNIARGGKIPVALAMLRCMLELGADWPDPIPIKLTD